MYTALRYIIIIIIINDEDDDEIIILIPRKYPTSGAQTSEETLTYLIYVAPVIQNIATEMRQAGGRTRGNYTAFHLTGVVMTTVLLPCVPHGQTNSTGGAERQSPRRIGVHLVCDKS